MEGNKDIPQVSPINKEWADGSPTIELNQICFVRAIKDPNQLIIKETNQKSFLTSVEDSSKGEYNVSTIHWTINHKVSSHSWGAWFDSKVIVITPGESLIRENGNPESMMAVDTFWSKEMVLPEGTIILSIGENNLNDKIVDGIQIIKSKTTKEELEKLKELEKDYLSDITNYQKESNYRSFGKEIDKKVTDEVDKVITDMNYSVLDNDHTTYMGNNNLDSAISDLSKRLGIKNSTLHENTIYAQMSDLIGEKGLLDAITDFQFKPTSEFAKETDFSSLIDSINQVFANQEIETKGQEDVLLRFSAQLYNAIIKYPQITDESINCDSLKIFFTSQPFILKNIERWSANDQKSGNAVKERIKNIKNIFKN